MVKNQEWSTILVSAKQFHIHFLFLMIKLHSNNFLHGRPQLLGASFAPNTLYHLIYHRKEASDDGSPIAINSESCKRDWEGCFHTQVQLRLQVVIHVSSGVSNTSSKRNSFHSRTKLRLHLLGLLQRMVPHPHTPQSRC